jgi:hypothetical protein
MGASIVDASVNAQASFLKRMELPLSKNESVALDILRCHPKEVWQIGITIP